MGLGLALLGQAASGVITSTQTSAQTTTDWSDLATSGPTNGSLQAPPKVSELCPCVVDPTWRVQWQTLCGGCSTPERLPSEGLGKSAQH